MNKPLILIAGGAGYIGSHMVKRLRADSFNVLVLDNFLTGFRDSLLGAPYVEGSIGDATLLEQLFSRHPVEAVINFASLIAVGESVQKPDLYYRNNVAETLVLLETMVRHGINKFLFSSTAAVYGSPDHVPVCETATKAPVSPYGRSKWMIEQVLEDFDRAFNFRSVALRYFNAAGADPDGELGERHDPETHLIPLALQVASGRRAQLDVYGDDYPTPDGTCIRDYIHVVDLCEAHRLALDHLLSGGESCAFNLGNGQGFSVNQVINTVEAVTGRNVTTRTCPRRSGDPPILVASSDAIRAKLGWSPRRAELAKIVEDAWRFELTLKMI
ncbi:MAG: UDP-glucose 4-epimerase GalE [Flavobacteriaceae bacterium]